jgi:hypothetical protein
MMLQQERESETATSKLKQKIEKSFQFVDKS